LRCSSLRNYWTVDGEFLKVLAGIVVGFTLLAMTARPAPAISVELAKKCRAMALHVYPYKPVGTPGKGDAQAERDYYSKCVANGGKMPNQPPRAGQSGGNQPPAAQPPH
jgi:hypothetical protein